VKYMVIDTESSGLFDFKRPADADGQPRLAELALVLLDENFEVESSMNLYIRPDGWEMQDTATAINGLTNEMLAEKGISIEVALHAYAAAIDEGRAVIAHNAQFDCKMVRGELRRAGMDDMFERTPNICTMRSLLAHAKQTGRQLIKYDAAGNPTNAKGWPKLSDGLRYYDLPQPEKAHGALDDALATAALIKAMVADGFDPTPEVHHSANYEAIKDAK